MDSSGSKEGQVWDLVNKVMNTRLPKIKSTSQVAEEVLLSPHSCYFPTHILPDLIARSDNTGKKYKLRKCFHCKEGFAETLPVKTIPHSLQSHAIQYEAERLQAVG